MGLLLVARVRLLTNACSFESEQDAHLDVLSQSINRQRDISIHIGSELEVHDGLLQDLDGQLDRTNGRLDSARRRLDQVARGTKNNG